MSERSERGERGERSEAPLRLFVGVRVSLATVQALEAEVAALRRAAGALPVRWVQPASYHITLSFLGWSRPEVVEALRDRVGAELAGARALEVHARGLGAFPTVRKARVLWAGVDPAAAAGLTDLAARVERATSALGFAREKRPYHPHVTLARLRQPADLTALLDGRSEQTYRSSSVEAVVLFESATKAGGSEYSGIASWSLEPSSKPPRRHTGPVETGSESDSAASGLRSSEETGDGDEQQGQRRGEHRRRA